MTVQGEILLVANSAEAAYDGKMHTAAGAVTDQFTFDEKVYTVSGYKTSDPNEKDAGSYANTFVTEEVVMRGIPSANPYVVKDSDGNDVTYLFVVTTQDGLLKINKAAVQLTSDNLSKTNDGTALTNGDTKLKVETGWAEGEGAVYTFTGSQNGVGSSSNSFTYKLNDNTKEENYDITVTAGTLTVTAVIPTPEPHKTCEETNPGSHWDEEKQACVFDPIPTPVIEEIITPVNEPTPTPNETVKPTEEAKVEITASPSAEADQPAFGNDGNSWALFNLILTGLSLIFAIVLILAKVKKEEDPDDDDPEIQYDENGNVIPETYQRKKGYKVLLAVIAILQIILFIFTENITNPMILVDGWTLLNVIITTVTVILFVIARKWNKEDDKDDTQVNA